MKKLLLLLALFCSSCGAYDEVYYDTGSECIVCHTEYTETGETTICSDPIYKPVGC